MNNSLISLLGTN